MNKRGFTLVEVLTVVVITGVLVAMAVPMYEKSMEKSRMAEVRTVMAKILDAKLRMMDELNIYAYNNDFGAQNLDVVFACASGTCEGTSFSTEHFTFSLKPSGTMPAGVTWRDSESTGVSKSLANGICAVRRKGENKGVAFLYLGELSEDPSKRLFCNDSGKTDSNSDGCLNYGMTSTGSKWCSES